MMDKRCTLQRKSHTVLSTYIQLVSLDNVLYTGTKATRNQLI